MALDTFARIGDIKGESLDTKHSGEIDVLAWSWGVMQTGTLAQGGGGGAGKASFQDFTFTHHIDKASPLLMKSCASGSHIKDATITVRKAGKGQQEYLVIELTDVLVTSVMPSLESEQGATHEGVTLHSVKVDLEYRPQNPDGSLDVGIHFKYDGKTNKVA